MAVVKPFQGWRYNAEKVSSLSEVVVPPYDVITPKELKELKEKNPHNFSNVILADGENKHQKAAGLFEDWQKQEVFIQDQKPCLYFYKQTFRLNANERFCQPGLTDVPLEDSISRTGMFCRVGLEEYKDKIVLPHEKTFAGPKADRYQLMDAAQGNMEPVFLGYPSERFSGDEFSKVVLGSDPVSDYVDSYGVRQQLWAVNDPKVHKEVEAALEGNRFYILDGHHRYETALKYYKDHEKSDARLAHRYLLANICSLSQPGAVILPTHRVVRGLQTTELEKVSEALEGQFQFEKIEGVLALEKRFNEVPKKGVFGLAIEGMDTFYFGQPNDALASKYDGSLDLDVLHEEVLTKLNKLVGSSGGSGEEVLGGRMHDQSHGDLDVGYIKSLQAFENVMNQKEYQLGFIVRPNTMKDVMSIADGGKSMPHKSTFFFPKIPSGLVVNQFE